MCIRLLYESKNFHVFTASLTPKVIVLFEVRSCDICILYLYIVIISCSTCCLVGPTHVALTGPTRQQELQLMMTRLKSKLAQTHVALTDPMRQQVLQLMMTRFRKIIDYFSLIMTEQRSWKKYFFWQKECLKFQYVLEIVKTRTRILC